MHNLTCCFVVSSFFCAGQNGAVHGLQSLRVVDASLLPLTVRGNIHLSILMLAEKLSDAIRAEYAGASAAVMEAESVARGRL